MNSDGSGVPAAKLDLRLNGGAAVVDDFLAVGEAVEPPMTTAAAHWASVFSSSINVGDGGGVCNGPSSRLSNAYRAAERPKPRIPSPHSFSALKIEDLWRKSLTSPRKMFASYRIRLFEMMRDWDKDRDKIGIGESGLRSESGLKSGLRSALGSESGSRS
uniref:Uncharacterized protein n=1 Tax=Romanomermis culicivorax TaxID=13658 RepID=A0A915HY93_ROMCU